MSNEHYIEDDNLSIAWARALRLAAARGRSEVAPLIVSITGFDASGAFREDDSIRSALGTVLATKNHQSVDTVASTIFPASLWNPARHRQDLFARYQRISRRVRHASRENSRGIYFERMIQGGANGRENQLEWIIKNYQSRRGVRRSALQVAIFDPKQDHSASALIGFPCLQHVTFAPTKAGLCMNAFYATQFLVERAYGNYVGLCRLGRFVAHELKRPLVKMTCFTGIAQCDESKADIRTLLATNDIAIAARDAAHRGES